MSAQVSGGSSGFSMKFIKRICSNIITAIHFSPAYLTECVDTSAVHIYESSGSLQPAHSPSKERFSLIKSVS